MSDLHFVLCKPNSRVSAISKLGENAVSIIEEVTNLDRIVSTQGMIWQGLFLNSTFLTHGGDQTERSQVRKEVMDLGQCSGDARRPTSGGGEEHGRACFISSMICQQADASF